ncbi:MAG: hypothetical protein ACYTKD_00640 [Planctomycetota bacterium]
MSEERKPEGVADEAAVGDRRCPHCGREFADALGFYRHACPAMARARPGGVTSMTPAEGAVALARFVYTHNPFYAVSACLVLYGLGAAFRPERDTYYGWILLGVLAGYTTLMAAAGVLIVRLGKVWEDARTIVLTVAALVLAISVSFDQMIIEQTAAGVTVLIAGLAFAVIISEGLVRGTRMRVAGLFRAPYYAIVALLYLYPLTLAAVVKTAVSGSGLHPVAWGLWLFPWAGAGALLTLVPAARRGKRAARKNGTPWAWPWFPWAIFAIMGGALALRSYWLALSFYPGRGMTSPWGLWFLAPLVLAGAVLLLEAALASGRKRLVGAAMGLPVVAVAMSFPLGSGRLEQLLVRELATELASPAMLVAVGAGLFYAYAWARRVREGEAGLALAFATLTVIGRGTVGARKLVAPQWWPIIVLGGIQAWRAWRERASWRAMAAAAAVVAALAAGLRGTWFLAARGAIPAHVLVACALVIGLTLHDRFGRALQAASAAALGVLFTTAILLWERMAPGVPGWALAPYLATLSATAAAAWLGSGNPAFMFALLAQAAACALRAGAGVYGFLARPDRPRGALHIFWGGVLFVVAAAVSIAKTGAPCAAIAKLAGIAKLTASARRRGTR